MRHPYESRTRNRDRSFAQRATTNQPTLVTWIVASLFAFILIVGFVLPILERVG
jgi:hypothetical protein